MTWSIENLLTDATRLAKALAAPVFAPALDWIFPVLGHDDDRPVVDTKPFTCRAPGPFDCLGCMVDESTLLPCRYGDGAEQLAEREADEEVGEPITRMLDDDGREVILDGPPYMFGRDIKVGEQYCGICGVQLGEECHACPALAARRSVEDDTLNRTEPGTAADVWQAQINAAYGCSITVEDSRTGGGIWLYSRTATEVNRAIHLPEDAVIELRDALFIRCAMSKSSADGSAQGPADSGEAVSDVPRSPASPQPDDRHWSDTQFSPYGFNPAADDSAEPLPVDAPPAVGADFAYLECLTEEILRRHLLASSSAVNGAFQCWCGESFAIIGEYTDHVAEIVISAVLDALTVAANGVNPLGPQGVETGHDMGCQWAAETFPQFTRNTEK